MNPLLVTDACIKNWLQFLYKQFLFDFVVIIFFFFLTTLGYQNDRT